MTRTVFVNQQDYVVEAAWSRRNGDLAGRDEPPLRRAGRPPRPGRPSSARGADGASAMAPLASWARARARALLGTSMPCPTTGGSRHAVDAVGEQDVDLVGPRPRRRPAARRERHARGPPGPGADGASGPRAVKTPQGALSGGPRPSSPRTWPRRAAGRHPGRHRPREPVHAAARRPVLRPAVRRQGPSGVRSGDQVALDLSEHPATDRAARVP